MAQTTMRRPTETGTPIISVRGIGVQFDRFARHRGMRELLIKGRAGRQTTQFWGLRDVSFDVQAGESIGVIGRNGQGKSTLLKIVAGVMLPDEGSVTVRAGVAPLIEMTGGFVPDLTARDNIYLVAGLHGMSRDAVDAKFEQIVEFAELRPFLDSPFRHLSSGMRVRLAFSVVSQLDEPILLVDEALAVGDKQFRERCYEKIEEILAEGRTLFFVSHAASDLKRFCKRGLYLQQGRLIGDGPIDEILERYAEDSRPPGQKAGPKAGHGAKRAGRPGGKAGPKAKGKAKPKAGGKARPNAGGQAGPKAGDTARSNAGGQAGPKAGDAAAPNVGQAGGAAGPGAPDGAGPKAGGATKHGVVDGAERTADGGPLPQGTHAHPTSHPGTDGRAPQQRDAASLHRPRHAPEPDRDHAEDGTETKVHSPDSP